ncbi:MAG: DNA repair protein RadC, partial [Candidatus Goldbacteria bacterium]|nr:DNA repair protein RadC [Candidatus Goldiibacteriota bacterium]
MQLKEKHYGLGHISRLKKRFLQNKISRYELIELLLSYVIKGKDIKPQTKEIFTKCRGNFRNIFNVIEKDKIKGIGVESIIFFRLLKEFINIYNEDKFINRKYTLKDQKDVIDYFKNICFEIDKEAVFVIFLDAKNRILLHKKISDGTLTQSVVYPREIIKEAINLHSLSIILIHNHPSGVPTPSENDKKITKRLYFACREMDLMLLDHLIVGNEGYFSFYENGLIEN